MNTRTLVVLIAVVALFASACGGKRTRILTPTTITTTAATATASWPMAEVREFTITGQPPVVEDEGARLVYSADAFPTLQAELDIQRVAPPAQTRVAESVDLLPGTRVINTQIRSTHQTSGQARLKVLTSQKTIEEMYPEVKGKDFTEWSPGGDPVRPHDVPPINTKDDIFKPNYWGYLEEAVKRFTFSDKTAGENAALQKQFLEQLQNCEEEDLPPYIRLMVNGYTISERKVINLNHPRLRGTAKKWCAFNNETVNARVGIIYFCANWAIAYTSYHYETETIRKAVPLPRFSHIRNPGLTEIRASLRFTLVRTLDLPPPPPPLEVSEEEDVEGSICGPGGWKCWLPAAIAGGLAAFLLTRGDDGPSPGLVKLPGSPGGWSPSSVAASSHGIGIRLR